MSDKLQLGKCNKVHGIRGGFLFNLFNQEDSSLREGQQIFLKKSGEFLGHKIEKIQWGNKTIVYLEGITDRDSSEKLVPFEIFIDKKDLPETQDGEYYIADLIGLKAITESGSDFGEVIDFYDNGAQVVLTIKTKTRSFDIPFVDYFFPEVDLENGIITVRPPQEIA